MVFALVYGICFKRRLQVITENMGGQRQAAVVTSKILGFAPIHARFMIFSWRGTCHPPF